MMWYHHVLLFVLTWPCLFQINHGLHLVRREANNILDVPDSPFRPLVTSFTSRSVDLSWPPSRVPPNSPVLHYIVYTRTNENGDYDQGRVTPDNQTKYKVEGLQPFTVYAFRVVAVNEHGASKPSADSYYINTPSEVPEGRPTGFHASMCTNSSVYVEWKLPPVDTIHGPLIGYRFKIGKDNIDDDDLQETIVTTGDMRKFTFLNLEPNTRYLITIQVYNDKGFGPAAKTNAVTSNGLGHRCAWDNFEFFDVLFNFF